MSPNLKISSGMKVIQSVVTCKFGVSVLFLLSTLTNTAVCQYPCIKIEHKCGCVYKNAKNEPMLISLSDLDYKNGNAYFLDHDGNYGIFHYYLNLCTETTDKKVVGCTAVTCCQVSDLDPKIFHPIAKSGPQTFGSYTLGQVFTVTYKKYRGRQMFVHLTYNADVIKKVTRIDDSPSNEYHVYIETKFLVPHPYPGKSSGGLSTGSIMLIVFFVILIIYLVAGILFMKYKMGATGKQVIPNIEFWSSLPGLVKDGCVFFAVKMKELCGQRSSQRDGYNEI